MVNRVSWVEVPSRDSLSLENDETSLQQPNPKCQTLSSPFSLAHTFLSGPQCFVPGRGKIMLAMRMIPLILFSGLGGLLSAVIIRALFSAVIFSSWRLKLMCILTEPKCNACICIVPTLSLYQICSQVLPVQCCVLRTPGFYCGPAQLTTYHCSFFMATALVAIGRSNYNIGPQLFCGPFCLVYCSISPVFIKLAVMLVKMLQRQEVENIIFLFCDREFTFSKIYWQRNGPKHNIERGKV